jgi:hypothetical protein
MKQIITCLFFLPLLAACNNNGYREVVNTVPGIAFCLDTAATNHANKMNIGPGRLRFLADKTFSIQLDQFPGAHLGGKWDVCCEASDYGNYVFSVEGLPEWKQADANLFVLLDKQQRRLYFVPCR